MAPERPSTLAMRWGLWAEPLLELLYYERTEAPYPLTQVGHLVSRAQPWRRGTPDRLWVDARRGVEFKRTNWRQAWRWGKGPADVPPDYLIQCQWYMALTGYETWDLCVLIGDDDFRRYPLTRDPELAGLLIDEGQRFWVDHILAKKPPPLDASTEAKAYVARQYPRATQPVRAATPEEAALVADYRAVVAQLDPLVSERERLATALKAAIGPAQGLTVNGHRATWSPMAGRRETDWHALALALGATTAQIEQFTTTGAPTRRFMCE